MTTGKISSVDAIAAGQGHEAAVYNDLHAKGSREKTHGDGRKGTGNIANAIHKETETKAQHSSYFGNHDARADLRC